MAGSSTSVDLSSLQGEYPFANTEASRMLAAGFKRAEEEQGLSQRTIAKMMNYRTSVVLSQMALGRAPIPIDRSLDLARLLKLDPSAFLLAVMEQRHPEVNFRRLLANAGKGMAKATSQSMLLGELEDLAGSPLDDLPVATANVLRDAVAERNPTRRWLKASEVPVVEHLRREKPEGLSAADSKKLMDFISAL